MFHSPSFCFWLFVLSTSFLSGTTSCFRPILYVSWEYWLYFWEYGLTFHTYFTFQLEHDIVCVCVCVAKPPGWMASTPASGFTVHSLTCCVSRRLVCVGWRGGPDNKVFPQRGEGAPRVILGYLFLHSFPWAYWILAEGLGSHQAVSPHGVSGSRSSSHLSIPSPTPHLPLACLGVGVRNSPVASPGHCPGSSSFLWPRPYLGKQSFY